MPVGNEREKRWVEGIKKAIKDRMGLELKAETLEELKEELDRMSILINDYAYIVHRAHRLRGERRLENLLEEHGYKWPPLTPKGGELVRELILVSLEELHESGYPYIQVYGATPERVLCDLGKHDHVKFNPGSVNIDSLGPNVFRIWLPKPVTVNSMPIFSTLEIYDDYTLE